MTIAIISDLHGNLPIYPCDWWGDLQSCELLLICGDILPLHLQRDNELSKEWLEQEFKPWASMLPVEHIYFIAGNHDIYMERNDKTMRELFPKYGKVAYLKNDEINYISLVDDKVYKIFGTPYCHQFGNWAFMRDSETLVNKFNEIPLNTDILITHDAPYGTSDICYEGFASNKGHIGCPELRDAIIEKKPSWCFHGHLHTSNHEIETLEFTKVINCSVLDESYNIKFKPQIITI
jgi:Icc-related predicted phosphoesterase